MATLREGSRADDPTAVPDGRWRLHTDGASPGNPGVAGHGGALYAPGGKLVYTWAIRLGVRTSNEAEWEGTLHGLARCAEWGVGPLTLFVDSMLVSCQLLGSWACKDPKLVPLRRSAVYHASRIMRSSGLQVVQVPRKWNAEADRLAGRAARGEQRMEWYAPEAFVWPDDRGTCAMRPGANLPEFWTGGNPVARPLHWKSDDPDGTMEQASLL